LRASLPPGTQPWIGRVLRIVAVDPADVPAVDLLFSWLLDLIWLNRRAEYDKDVEILLLRQQVRILQRKQSRPPRISRWEKLTLLVFQLLR